MRAICCKTYDELSAYAADIVCETLKNRPNAVLALPTGSTPLGMYEELIARCGRGEVSFRNSSFFILDEYVDLPPAHTQSYNYYMRDRLFSHIDLPESGIHMLIGDTADDDAECDRYTRLLDSVEGGIDLLILGIGANGHIGFNEPSDAFFPDTHKILLTDDTVEANARFFDNPDEVPRFALTMGVRPMLRAKKILLLAYGSGKSVAVAKALNGPITPLLPASILQLHTDATIVADEGALQLAAR